jgi:hypothetical protein
LIAVLLGIVSVNVLGLAAHGVEIVGKIPAGLPPLGLPAIKVSDLERLIGPAAGVVLIGLDEGFSAAKAYGARTHDRIDANRELLGLGAREREAVRQGVQKPALADPRSALHNLVVHDRDLPGGPPERDAAELEPEAEGLAIGRGRAPRPGDRWRARTFRSHPWASIAAAASGAWLSSQHRNTRSRRGAGAAPSARSRSIGP